MKAQIKLDKQDVRIAISTWLLDYKSIEVEPEDVKIIVEMVHYDREDHSVPVFIGAEVEIE